MMVRRGVGFPGTGITGSQDEVKYWIDGQQTMNTQRVVRDTWSACATRDKGNKKKNKSRISTWSCTRSQGCIGHDRCDY